MDESEFLKHLYNEKLKAQEARTNYTVKKLTYATTLLGLGSLNIDVTQITAAGDLNLGLLLYLAPWVALAFDLYILGEDYSVKRFGVFLKQNSPDPLEKTWEEYVSKKRDPFAPFAMPALTTLVLIGASVIILAGGSVQGLVFGLWSALTLLLTWSLYFYYQRLRKTIDRLN